MPPPPPPHRLYVYNMKRAKMNPLAAREQLSKTQRPRRSLSKEQQKPHHQKTPIPLAAYASLLCTRDHTKAARASPSVIKSRKTAARSLKTWLLMSSSALCSTPHYFACARGHTNITLARPIYSWLMILRKSQLFI